MIACDQILKRFGGTVAVDGISLSVAQGELLTLLGPSGCGKTTLLRCVSGSLKPENGRIRIGGEDVTGWPVHRRNIGMVFQSFALMPHMTVAQNVAFPFKVRRIGRAERDQRVSRALETVRLSDFADRLPRQLSGGQQQRVGLARAIVYRPTVLLMDEPLSNLDANLREQMRFEIKELQKALGITTMYVTHDQGEALALSDRIAVMNAGRIEQVGGPSDIYDRPDTRFVAGFVGLANFLPARTRSDVSDSAVEVEIAGMGAERLPISATAAPSPGTEVLVFVRPNDLVLAPANGGAANGRPVGAITKVTYLGERNDYVVVLDGAASLELRVQTSRKQIFSLDQKVSVALPQDGARVIERSVDHPASIETPDRQGIP